MQRWSHLLVTGCVFALGQACSFDTEPGPPKDRGTIEAGAGRAEGGIGDGAAPDGALDAGSDAQPAEAGLDAKGEADAGPDTGSHADAGMDSGMDAGATDAKTADAAPEAGPSDAGGVDAAADSAPPDAGAGDAAPADSGPTGPCVGQPDGTACDDADACTDGDVCQDGACQGGPALVCDDGNACTTDRCDSELGCTFSNNSALCDDGDQCTAGDRCTEGVCQGVPLACDDGDACTTDRCDSSAGCVYEPGAVDCSGADDACNVGVCNPSDGSCDKQPANEGASCDDGDLCTEADLCAAGVCAGAALACDDGNVCTDDACDPAVGCQYTPNTASCDDGEVCTTADRCSAGSCVGGAPPSCDDGNLCTDDGCSAGVGCVHEPNTASCDDGDACTTADQCSAGTCTGGPALSCDDGNLCTTDRCDSASGCVFDGTGIGVACAPDSGCDIDFVCQGDMAGTCAPSGTKDCSAAADQCNTGRCDGATGACQAQPVSDGTACDDANACTVSDQCSSGSCQGSARSCDDGNPCTDDSCDPSTGCVHTPNTDACDDGNACTTGDRCGGGSCVGGPARTCADGNGCTDDRCDPALGCVYTNNTSACDDGNACTSGDQCAAGSCRGGAAVACSDGNLCTDDSCDPALGCVYANNTLACDDGNACTSGDRCAAGSCQGETVRCDDGNVCTADRCEPSSGCVYDGTGLTASCAPDTACDTGFVCQGDAAGTCAPSATRDCSALSDQCNVGACDPATGDCEAQPVGDGTGCDDGNACTVSDQCASGACQGAARSCDDGNPCTDDSCDPSSGCVHTPNTHACDDGNACTLGDRCGGGSCQGGAARACGDGNPCTDDSCDPAVGCVNANNSASCDDGNACTAGDQCAGGSCQSGAPLVCNDGNLCTDNLCDPALGCVHPSNSASCDDGNVCTTGDQCAGGSCQPGSAISCDDDNVCTADSCDPVLGCVHDGTGITEVCAPDNACDTGFVCQGDEDGTCSPTGTRDCSSFSDQCNVGTCDPSTGACSATPLPDGTACSDGNACTANDVCQAGSCRSGAALNCNDGNLCTNDSCDPSVGCQYSNNTVSCDDGNACTVADQCAGGSCQSGSPLSCSDGNVCTDDVCDPALGCVFPNNSVSCDDGNVCTTGDQCAGGSCQSGSSRSCSDGNVCTDDVCDPVLGCVFPNNAASCDDGNACTLGDQCAGGSCQGGSARSCDDGNVCTADRCDPDSGCVNDGTGVGGSCGPDVLCDTAFLCQGDASGSCAPTGVKDCSALDDQCNVGVCDGATGSCQQVPAFDGLACDDGNACTTGDQCSAGSCVASGALGCDDANPCTADRCIPSMGCVNDGSGVTAPCAPDMGCDIGFVCQGDAIGTCAPTSMKDCSPIDDQCNAGMCDPASGNCVAVPVLNGTPCDDGDACSAGDQCTAGVCGGGPRDCDDGNTCTDDSCDSGLGCVYANNTDPCDDGSVCTQGDVCGGGSCGGSDPCGDFGSCVEGSGSSYSCDCASGFTDVGGACVCDLNGDFAVRIETTFSWTGIGNIEDSNDATHPTPVTALSWALRRHTYGSDGSLQVSTEPCGGFSPDLCGSGEILSAEAYAQYQPTTVWQGPAMPVTNESMTIVAPLPGSTFRTPLTAALLGISLDNPFGAWPSSRSDVGGSSPTNGAQWVDHDTHIDSSPAVTSFVVPPGGVGGSMPPPPIPYSANSVECPRLSGGSRLPYNYVPGLEGFSIRRIKRIFLGTRIISGFDGTFAAGSCDTITGSTYGPTGHPYLRADARFQGCVRVDGSDEATCSGTVANFLDTQPQDAQQVDNATFTMQRLSGPATCENVRATLP